MPWAAVYKTKRALKGRQNHKVAPFQGAGRAVGMRPQGIGPAKRDLRPGLGSPDASGLGRDADGERRRIPSLNIAV